MGATFAILCSVIAVAVGLWLLLCSWVGNSGGAGLDDSDLELQEKDKEQ